MQIQSLPIIAIINVNDPDAGYLAGISIALLILAYLVYSLIKPEKFG